MRLNSKKVLSVLTLQQSDLSKNATSEKQARESVLTLQQSDLSKNPKLLFLDDYKVLTLQQSDLSKNGRAVWRVGSR